MPAGDGGVRVRRVAEGDLSSVLAWRNHPDVRKFMLTQHEITLEEHLRWFERASRDPGRCLLIAEEEGRPLGFVHFTGVGPDGVADWGFYAAPEVPRGSGRKLGEAALDHAFQALGLHKVCGQALGFNEASIRFHLRLGFQQEGVLRRQHRLGDAWHDLVCFGLLREEWSTRRGGGA